MSSQPGSLTRGSQSTTYNYLNGSGSTPDVSTLNNPFQLQKAQSTQLTSQLYKGGEQARVGSAAQGKQNNFMEYKQAASQNTIGIRSSFTQKPPTDMRNQPQIYQKNLKYLDSNRLGSTGNATSSEDKPSSTNVSASLGSSKREQQIYRSMNGAMNSGRENSNGPY